MSDLPIRPYERLPAAFHPWDPAAPEVARGVARLVASAVPGAVVEHVGSSAVPGLPGKNILDLGIEADPDDIPAITDALLSLGFGRQGGVAPFPPTRPMLTGAVEHQGEPYRIHLHVMPPARGELAELTAFREALRTDPALCHAYARGQAPDRRGGARRPAEPAVHRAQGGLRPRRAVPDGDPPPVGGPVAPLPPGSTIGIMGGGQLGRMLAVAARAMGYRIVALDPDPACPTAAVADELIVGRYDDVDAARRLGERSDVVTYELEHVGLDAAAAAGEHAPLRPGLAALRATQDRLAERRFIRSIGEYVAPWREVRGIDDAEAAADALGYPCRLKLPLGGYDGRSQARIRVRVPRSRPRSARWAARTAGRCCSRRRSTSRPSCR